MSNIVTQSRVARFISVLLITLLIVTAMPVNMWQVHAATSSSADTTLTLDKDVYEVGESIMVTADGLSGDWVAVYPKGKTTGTSLRWYNVTPGGKTDDLIYCKNDGGITDTLNPLEVGEYTVVIMRGDYVVQSSLDITVKAPEVEGTVLSTDKTEYKCGEPIMVEYNYTSVGNTWIGLYKADDTPSGTDSLAWDYLTGIENKGKGNPFDITDDYFLSGKRTEELTAGDYKVVLFSNSGYDIAATAEFTLVHDKEYTWNGKAENTHSVVCNKTTIHNEPERIATEQCQYDVEVIKEATDTEKGSKKYTCSVCKGTYEEEVPATADVVTVTKEPTCTEPGSKTIEHSDGTVDKNVEIPALGHKFEAVAADYENGVYNHKCIRKDCGETEACGADSKEIKNRVLVVTCKTCKESHEESVLTTDKTEYKYGEPIMVTWNHKTADNDWIGIYKRGETYDTNAGGVKSIYWYYVGQDGYSNPVDIRATRNENNRSGEFVAGEYTIVMFEKGSYTDIASIDITITKDVVSEVQTTAPTCENAGKITITYTDGTTDTKPVDKLGHAYPENWTYNAETKQHEKTCANDGRHVVKEDCTFKGKVTTEPTYEAAGVKTFTCTECEGTYTEEIPALSDEVIDTVVTQATCTEDGIKTITYKSGKVTTEVVETALGHKYNKPVYNDNETHTMICQREGCTETTKGHEVTEGCDFYEGVIEDGKVTFVCKECSGVHQTSVLTTDKDAYALGTHIMVTAYSNVEGAWVAIYATGDQSHRYWHYVSDAGNGVPYSVFDGTGKYPIEDGVYTIKLWEGDKVVAEKQITVGDPSDNHIYLEKNNFDIGEPVNITTDYNTAADWVAIFEIGNPEYINWYRPSSVTEPYNVLEKTGDLGAGNYAALLYADNESTYLIGQVGFKVGHTFVGDWIYDGKEANTHHKVCDGVNKHKSEPEKCNYVEEITTAPTNDTAGVKTFTCTVCEGSYTEEIPSLNDTVVSVVTTEATCTEPSKEITTYASGATKEVILGEGKVLGHDYAKPAYNNDKTHTATCQREGCTVETKDHTLTSECDFDAASENGKVTYTCKDCDGSYEVIVLTTEKTHFDIDEPIDVEYDYTPDNSDAWIAVYKKGDIYGDGEGAVKSIYWGYLREYGNPVNVLATKDENSRGDEYGEGEYTIMLFSDSGYDVVTTLDVTVGHEFGDWAPTADRTVKDNCEHAKVCDGTLKHEEKEKCTFGEGVQTKAPTATEAGTMTFTCTVCGGTYVEVLPALGDKVVSDVTTPATCEDPSIRTITYESGIVKTEEVAPALGHDYDKDTAKFDEATKTHSVTCKNDSKHVKTETCDFETVSVKDGTVTHKCTVCGGTFESGLLYVEKDTYAASDNIDVIATCDAKDSWVGLYGIDEKADPNNGGVVSYYWYTVTGDGIDRSGKKITLTDFYNVDRGEGLTPGEYKIVLFGDGKYSNVLAEKQITITESKTTYEVKMKDKVVADGETVAYDSKDSIKVNVTSDGNPGQAWVGIYPGKYDKSHDFSTTTSTQWYNISEYNGKDFTVTSQDLKEDGVYTVAVFGDGAYSNIKHMSYYTVTEEGLTEEIIEQPTCTKPGVKKVLYEGDTEPTYVPIPALGHDIELVYDKDAKTHSGECTRCDYVADGEPCTFDEGVVTDNIKTYTCTKCGGQYTEEAEKPLPPYTEENGRVAGNDRFDTALEAAEQLKKTLEVEKFENIIIASGMDYADALSGTYLAKIKNAPILLINGKNDSVMKEIADYANANLAEGGTIYILGGEVAVPVKFNTYLDSEKVKISRLAGKNRYETNLAILQEAGVEGSDILVCTGTNFADSLSASASGKAILLVGGTLEAKQKEFLSGLKDKKYYILGGTVAVSNSLEDMIRTYGGTERISGKNRFETSVKFAERFFENPKAAVLTYGLNFPDGLAGGVLAMSMDAPLILTAANNDTFAKEYTKANNIVSGVVLGGTKLISEAAAMSIFNVAK